MACFKVSSELHPVLGFCDRYTWPVNQTSSSLVQASMEVKAWAIARLRTLSRNPQRNKATQWASTHEFGTSLMRLTHEERVVFPRLIYQETKKVVGTRGLMHTFPLYAIWLGSKHIIPSIQQPKWTFFELSLLGSIAPWRQYPLEVEHLSRLLLEAGTPFTNDRSLDISDLSSL